MATAWKKLGQGQLTGGGTKDTLYTVPASTEAIIRLVRFVNNDSSDRWVIMWHDGVADSNKILPQMDIPLGGVLQDTGVIVMEAADTLRAEGEVAAQITYTVYGMEES